MTGRSGSLRQECCEGAVRRSFLCSRQESLRGKKKKTAASENGTRREISKKENGTRHLFAGKSARI
jgi:hypothetical protein